MKVQVLTDGVDRGTAELTGPGLDAYAHAMSGFCNLLRDIYFTNNPDAGVDLVVDAVAKFKPRKPSPRARR